MPASPWCSPAPGISGIRTREDNLFPRQIRQQARRHRQFRQRQPGIRDLMHGVANALDLAAARGDPGADRVSAGLAVREHLARSIAASLRRGRRASGRARGGRNNPRSRSAARRPRCDRRGRNRARRSRSRRHRRSRAWCDRRPARCRSRRRAREGLAILVARASRNAGRFQFLDAGRLRFRRFLRHRRGERRLDFGDAARVVR